MPNDSPDLDQEIIRAAYAEKVKEIFKLFAEAIAVGQNEKASRDRFVRSLELMRKARDAALMASSGAGIVEPTGADKPPETVAPEPLSEEDQALVDQALSGTTGARPPAPRPANAPFRRW